MANTFTQICIQIVFSTHQRQCVNKNEFKDELNKYITGIVKNKQHKF